MRTSTRIVSTKGSQAFLDQSGNDAWIERDFVSDHPPRDDRGEFPELGGGLLQHARALIDEQLDGLLEGLSHFRIDHELDASRARRGLRGNSRRRKRSPRWRHLRGPRRT